MNEIKNQRMIAPIFFVLCLALGVSGQDWRKIIPLHTTCEEVKIILNVKECSIPVSKYKFSDIEFNINFSKGDAEGDGYRRDSTPANSTAFKRFRKGFRRKSRRF